MTKPESETDPWAKVKRRQGTVIEHGPGVLGGGAWSAKAAVYLAKEVDAARAAEAAQHQQALERLTRQAQDISVTLGEAGCRAMPIVDGVRWLVDHNLQLRARLAAVEEERDMLKGELEASADAGLLSRAIDESAHFEQLYVDLLATVGQAPPAESPAPHKPVVNLMEALKKSLDSLDSARKR